MTIRRSLAVGLAASALVALPGALAQVTITPVIVQGQPAPGSVGTFNAPQTPAMQAPKRLAAFSFLAGTPQPGFDSAGIWQATPGSVGLVAIQAQPIGGSGAVNISTLGSPTQNRAGQVLFPMRLASGFATDTGLAFSTGVGAQFAVREGDAAPGIPGATFNELGLASLPDYAINDSGEIAFLAFLNGVPTANNTAIFVGDAATQSYSLVAQRGQASPLPGGAPMSFITAPGLNGAGDVAFFSNLSAAPFFGLFYRPAGGPLQAAVAAGDPAPGFDPGWTISSLVGANSGPPQFNDQGVFAVAGGAQAPGGFPSSVGLWRGAPGALQLVAKKGDVAPGHPNNAQFNDFQPLINRRGALVFYSNVNAGPQNAGVWMALQNGPVRLLALLNAQAPDMPVGTLLTSISNGGIGLNNRAEGLINASLNYVVGATPANGIFAGRPGRLRKVVASGDPLEVSPGVFRTPVSILCWTWNSPETGRQTSINDRGEVAFSCSFTGGGGGAFIARLPHPCPGDANADDMIGFADLNAVLAAFNSVIGAPNFNQDADFDQDDDVDFADLNAVLAAFNSGC